jgi:hypothetical protein
MWRENFLCLSSALNCDWLTVASGSMRINEIKSAPRDEKYKMSIMLPERNKYFHVTKFNLCLSSAYDTTEKHDRRLLSVFMFYNNFCVWRHLNALVI